MEIQVYLSETEKAVQLIPLELVFTVSWKERCPSLRPSLLILYGVVFQCLSTSMLKVNLPQFEMTIHLGNIAVGAAFLKCNY